MEEESSIVGAGDIGAAGDSLLLSYNIEDALTLGPDVLVTGSLKQSIEGIKKTILELFSSSIN